MKRRRLLLGSVLAGFGAVALLGLGPAQSEPERTNPAPEETLRRIAELNGEAAVNAQIASRERSEASAEAADARILRQAEAASR